MGTSKCNACISAIIEREHQGEKQILIMTRWKPKRDPIYSGTLEIPAGLINEFEDIHTAIKREVLEETGLTVTEVYPKKKTKIHSVKDDGAFGFTPLFCQQQIKGGKPWIGFIFLCKVKDENPVANPDECKDIQWVNYDELKKIYEQAPEKIFTFQLPALEMYFEYVESKK